MAAPDSPLAPIDQLVAEDGARQPGDDFYCLRYEVWYPSFDCAVRTRFRTSRGCLKCEQGRFNLKRHLLEIRRVRYPLASCD